MFSSCAHAFVPSERCHISKSEEQGAVNFVDLLGLIFRWVDRLSIFIVLIYISFTAWFWCPAYSSPAFSGIGFPVRIFRYLLIGAKITDSLFHPLAARSHISMVPCYIAIIGAQFTGPTFSLLAIVSATFSGLLFPPFQPVILGFSFSGTVFFSCPFSPLYRKLDDYFLAHCLQPRGVEERRVFQPSRICEFLQHHRNSWSCSLGGAIQLGWNMLTVKLLGNDWQQSARKAANDGRPPVRTDVASRQLISVGLAGGHSGRTVRRIT